ncbi:MAG: hypothetical protein KY476_03660 [Planctomycetes bacterium]|nr:hypothetical protein [Planctomycetota bacterium]
MFRVIWERLARDELARHWLAADSARRKAITEATAKVDAVLERNPFEAGESRSGDRRILLVRPLGVFYRVVLEEMRVEVVHVVAFRKH